MANNRRTCEPRTKKPNEVLLVRVSFRDDNWRDTEKFTGTPVVTDPTGTLTIDNEAFTTEEFLNKDKKIVPVGRGIQFTVADGDAGTIANVAVGCGTDGTPAQFLEVTCPIEVKDED